MQNATPFNTYPQESAHLCWQGFTYYMADITTTSQIVRHNVTHSSATYGCVRIKFLVDSQVAIGGTNFNKFTTMLMNVYINCKYGELWKYYRVVCVCWLAKWGSTVGWSKSMRYPRAKLFNFTKEECIWTVIRTSPCAASCSQAIVYCLILRPILRETRRVVYSYSNCLHV